MEGSRWVFRFNFLCGSPHRLFTCMQPNMTDQYYRTETRTLRIPKSCQTHKFKWTLMLLLWFKVWIDNCLLVFQSPHTPKLKLLAIEMSANITMRAESVWNPDMLKVTNHKSVLPHVVKRQVDSQQQNSASSADLPVRACLASSAHEAAPPPRLVAAFVRSLLGSVHAGAFVFLSLLMFCFLLAAACTTLSY